MIQYSKVNTAVYNGISNVASSLVWRKDQRSESYLWIIKWILFDHTSSINSNILGEEPGFWATYYRKVYPHKHYWGWFQRSFLSLIFPSLFSASLCYQWKKCPLTAFKPAEWSSWPLIGLRPWRLSLSLSPCEALAETYAAPGSAFQNMRLLTPIVWTLYTGHLAEATAWTAFCCRHL